MATVGKYSPAQAVREMGDHWVCAALKPAAFTLSVATIEGLRDLPHDFTDSVIMRLCERENFYRAEV